MPFGIGRGGGEDPFERVKHLAEDIHDAAKFVGEKVVAKVAPARAEAVPHAAEIAAISDAIRRHDEPAIAAILEKGDPDLAARLFEADLPQWVPPGEYTETLKTGPDEAWRVKWMYGFDASAAMDRLIGNWAPFAKGLGDVHKFVRKEFPREKQAPGAGNLAGGTTFGYDPATGKKGRFTPNDIRMTEVINERTGKKMPVALMTYSEKPWFSKATGTGFNDEFKAIAPNIVLARGKVSVYANENMHGAAAEGKRPPLSTALSKLAGGERKGPAPGAIAFWMYRTDKKDPKETPVWKRAGAGTK